MGLRHCYSDSFLNECGLVNATDTLHTPVMTLKNAALLALIGMILLTALRVGKLIFDVVNAVRGLVPALTLLSSLIYAFACFSVAVFFYLFFLSGHPKSGQ